MTVYKDDPMNEEFIHLRFEFNRTIEYMKNRMLKFLYYSSLLQVAIIAYFQLVKSSLNIQVYIILLSLISIFIAIDTMYFLMKYHKDYQYYLYRSEIYIDPKFSIEAKKCLDVPISSEENFPDEIIDIDEFIENYYPSYKDQPFQKLYFLFNWMISLLVILYLLNSWSKDFSFLDNSKNIIIVLLVMFIVSFGFAELISDKLKAKLRRSLREHKKYVKKLDNPVNKIDENPFKSIFEKFQQKIKRINKKFKNVGGEPMIDCNVSNNQIASEEVKLLYPLYLENIENAKKQQWQIAYYFFLLQGALIGLKNLNDTPIIYVASVCVTFFSIVIVWVYRCDIELYQMRKDSLKNLFTTEIKACVFKSEESDESNVRLCEMLRDKKRPWIVYLMYLIFIVMQILVFLI